MMPVQYQTQVDSNHYPNWTQLISHLNSTGVKVLTYINPLVSNVSERGTPYNHNYYKEALDNGYAVWNRDGSVWTGYSNSILTDLSNPSAYQWMKNIIVKNMLATGVCGWMCDFGEAIPLDAALSSDADPHKYHSLYPDVWARLNTDAIRDAGELGGSCNSDDIVFFMRSGNVMSPRSTQLFWLGDQTVTWDSHDGLATAVIGMLTQGLSGYSLTHSDIGGYTAIDYFPLRYVRSKNC
jgi:alpha-glucosidase